MRLRRSAPPDCVSSLLFIGRLYLKYPTLADGRPSRLLRWALSPGQGFHRSQRDSAQQAAGSRPCVFGKPFRRRAQRRQVMRFLSSGTYFVDVCGSSKLQVARTMLYGCFVTSHRVLRAAHFPLLDNRHLPLLPAPLLVTRRNRCSCDRIRRCAIYRHLSLGLRLQQDALRTWVPPPLSAF